MPYRVLEYRKTSQIDSKFSDKNLLTTATAVTISGEVVSSWGGKVLLVVSAE